LGLLCKKSNPNFERGKAGIYKFQVKATVNDELAAEAAITCAVRKKGN